MKPPQRGNPKGRDEPRATLNIEAVLTFYGYDVPSGSGWRKLKCHGERKASACVNLEEGAFTCFSCGLKGDAIGIIRKMEGDCSYAVACQKYTEITGEEVPGLHQRRSNETATAAEKRSYEASGWLASKLKGH